MQEKYSFVCISYSLENNEKIELVYEFFVSGKFTICMHPFWNNCFKSKVNY